MRDTRKKRDKQNSHFDEGQGEGRKRWRYKEGGGREDEK